MLTSRHKTYSSLVLFLFAMWLPTVMLAEVSRIDVTSRQLLSSDSSATSYESIQGVVYYTLDPTEALNQSITDIEFAPINAQGKVEFSADFRLLVPQDGSANGGLLYNVNNRGGSRFPPEISLSHPLSKLGFTYLATGWIAELEPAENRLRLHAPVVKSGSAPITGDVRYEISVMSPTESVAIAGARHLAYTPTEQGLRTASLTRRLYQSDPRQPIERSEFTIEVNNVDNSQQPGVSLELASGFEPGVIYELIYEAKDPVLAGAGMAAIRDLVSLLRHGGDEEEQLTALGVPPIEHTVAWGNSQSGRLLRQYLYDGFNADLEGRRVFDGVIPVIAGGGYGMFNNRFAMPTRTNGQHSNYLYPNDLFPFTYGPSEDPFTGKIDSVLSAAEASDTVPKLMHIQTSNEYWVRAGSLPHTNPEGSADAEIPENVRFYTIGGSQHGSGNGIARPPTSGQLPPNPNMWAPFTYSLMVSMYEWVARGSLPPESKYPKIADGSLVKSHINGEINPSAWKALEGINSPKAIYKPAWVDYGSSWQSQRIIDRHPDSSDSFYGAMVPAVNSDNNDFSHSTILPPLTEVPLATFVPWNLRAFETGAVQSLARLSGGYIPFAENVETANSVNDPRSTVNGLYDSFEDYFSKYENATDALIEEGYLLPEFKEAYMNIARQNRAVFFD